MRACFPKGDFAAVDRWCFPRGDFAAVDRCTDSFQKLDSKASFLWTDPVQAFPEHARASHETIRDSTAVNGHTDSFQKRLDSTAGFLWTDPSQAFLERARASHETIRDSTAVGECTDSLQKRLDSLQTATVQKTWRKR